MAFTVYFNPKPGDTEFDLVLFLEDAAAEISRAMDEGEWHAGTYAWRAIEYRFQAALEAQYFIQPLIDQLWLSAEARAQKSLSMTA